jgi:diguanylate cyclase
MVDIDLFKKFNDTYGHTIGDDVLQFVGSLLYDNLKGRDFPARYGGEEFIVLLPSTVLDNACIVAEEIRRRLSDKKLKHARTGESLGKVTASLGVAQIAPGDTINSLLDRADKAVYKAKNSGRNNVKSEKDL